MMIKNKIAKAAASLAEKIAKAACGTASHFGSYQFKEPVKLKKSAK